MTKREKIKTFEVSWAISTKHWTPKPRKELESLCREVWLDGFNIGHEVAERNIKAKADKLLEKFGI